jgi:hypothetical protein
VRSSEARFDAGGASAGTGAGADVGDVGAFRPGTSGSRWALSRYLVGRAIGEQVATALLVVALAVIAIAVGLYLVAPAWLAVMVGVIGLGLLLMRAAVGALIRRVTGVGRFGALEERVQGLVAETRGDVRRELRRLGLPSHTVTMPVLAVRLLGRRRGEVIDRLRDFDIDRVVPAGRVDDVHLVMQALQRDSGRATSGFGTYPPRNV